MMLKRNIMPAMSNKKMPIPNETLDITSWLSKGLSKTSREKMKPRFAKNKKIYTQMWLNNAFQCLKFEILFIDTQLSTV